MLDATNLMVGYGTAVAGPFNFSFKDGECVMMCGPNGSGKSTLMKTLAGLEKPVSGSFKSNGTVVMVPTRIPKVKGFTVREFIKTSLSNGDSIKDIDAVMSLLGLQDLAEKDISRISDGEFQKACIATALTRKASVILLDEPTAFLDVDNRVMILKTLQELAHSKGMTIIFSTHDIYDGEKHSDSVLKLEKKSI